MWFDHAPMLVSKSWVGIEFTLPHQFVTVHAAQSQLECIAMGSGLSMPIPGFETC
uniref:Uncharacterized protein n=1 Tax=Physcomitrium patens TaxID=3218 RepID=A0A2K1KHK1_PHYPA|nr:hypothetical protein PHYPA_009642 [Physcomitrium patens]